MNDIREIKLVVKGDFLVGKREGVKGEIVYYGVSYLEE